MGLAFACHAASLVTCKLVAHERAMRLKQTSAEFQLPQKTVPVAMACHLRVGRTGGLTRGTGHWAPIFANGPVEIEEPNVTIPRHNRKVI